MTDLHKRLFESKAKVSDRAVPATARLNACVNPFADQLLGQDVIDRVNAAIAEAIHRMVAHGFLHEWPDWLAVIVSPRADAHGTV